MRKEFTRFIVTIFYSLIGLAVLVSMSCGGGGGSSASTPATTPNSPQISGLQYTPQTANLNEGNGAITITAIINFTDPDGDVATVTINKYGAQETTLLSTNTYPIQNISGLVSGSITIIGQIRTTTVGDFTLEVYITDRAGNSSNKLTGTFRVTDPLYAKTLLLRGKWHFVFTIINTFTYDYSLSTISTTKNSQGGYWIYGTNQYGGSVIAGYWPTSGYWALGDYNYPNIDMFYVFYTDGVTILPNSCYYQINKSTGAWSPCFSLSGSKISPTPDIAFDNTMIQPEEELLLENTTFVPIDDDTKDKYLQLKNEIDQRSASPK